MRKIIVVLFSVAFFVPSQQVVSTMIDDVFINISRNRTGNGTENATDYFIVERRTPAQVAMCNRLNEIKSTPKPRITSSSGSDKSKDLCRHLTEIQTCLQKNCKWTRGNCKDKNNFPVVPPEAYADTIHLFKSVMWDHRRTPSRGNAIFWLTFLGGSCAIVFFLALSFFMSPLMACCRRVFDRLKGKVSRNGGITMILPQGKKFPTDDYIVRRRVPRKGDILLKQFLETTRAIPVKIPVATKKEDLESPDQDDGWQYDPTKDKDKLFTTSGSGVCPRIVKISAHNNNDTGDITKILNIPPEPHNSTGGACGMTNFVEVICEKENADSYSSNSTSSSFNDRGFATSSTKHEFNALSPTFHELNDIDKSKNVILLNLQSNFQSKNPSSSQHHSDKSHDYIIDKMPIDVDESTV